MRFKELNPESWVSPKQNNSDFDYWLVIKFIDCLEATGELWEGHKYHVELIAVSPSEAGPENLKHAFNGWETATAEVRANPIVQVEALVSYGVYAPLWQTTGNNLRKLLKQAHEQAQCASSLFGFYMDGPKNRIGATGWDVIKGNLDPARILSPKA